MKPQQMGVSAFYNDHEPGACAWLSQLCKRNLIARGDISRESIRYLSPETLAAYTQVHLFAGIGGWSYALRLAGWPDDRPVWTGSCPCQPFSSAGKRKGTSDRRHLWPEMFRLIGECRPGVIFGEQVAGKAGLGWLDGVFADLEGAGYACGAVVLGAHSVGAPHIRQRLFWVADSEGFEAWRKKPGDKLPIADSPWKNGIPQAGGCCGRHRRTRRRPSGIRVVADGVSANVDANQAIGNAINPWVAAEFIRAYMAHLAAGEAAR